MRCGRGPVLNPQGVSSAVAVVRLRSKDFGVISDSSSHVGKWRGKEGGGDGIGIATPFRSLP